MFSFFGIHLEDPKPCATTYHKLASSHKKRTLSHQSKSSPPQCFKEISLKTQRQIDFKHTSSRNMQLIKANWPTIEKLLKTRAEEGWVKEQEFAGVLRMCGVKMSEERMHAMMGGDARKRQFGSMVDYKQFYC